MSALTDDVLRQMVEPPDPLFGDFDELLRSRKVTAEALLALRQDVRALLSEWERRVVELKKELHETKSLVTGGMLNEAQLIVARLRTQVPA